MTPETLVRSEVRRAEAADAADLVRLRAQMLADMDGTTDRLAVGSPS
jgi:hypothetical protein